MAKATEQEKRLFVKSFCGAVRQMHELRNISREQLADKSKVSIDLLTRIEECRVVGDEPG